MLETTDKKLHSGILKRNLDSYLCDVKQLFERPIEEVLSDSYPQNIVIFDSEFGTGNGVPIVEFIKRPRITYDSKKRGFYRNRESDIGFRRCGEFCALFENEWFYLTSEERTHDYRRDIGLLTETMPLDATSGIDKGDKIVPMTDEDLEKTLIFMKEFFPYNYQSKILKGNDYWTFKEIPKGEDVMLFLLGIKV